MYVKVRIPRRSAPNWRKRDSSKEAPKTAELRRLMADPKTFDARLQMRWLPHYHQSPDGTCSIGDIATDMADVMLSTAAKLAPRSKRPRGAQGWCAGPGVEAEVKEDSMAIERSGKEAVTRRTPPRQPLKGREDGWKKSSEGSQGCLVRKLETRAREGDLAGFYKHLRDDESGREARPQLGVRQTRGRRTPEGR